MSFNLPRPCHYADIQRFGAAGNIPVLGLVADGQPSRLFDAVVAWQLLTPTSQILLFCTAEYKAEAERLTSIKTNIAVYLVDSYRNIGRVAEALGCKWWGTCDGYDAYGVLVKKPIETVIRALIRRNNGTYLVHDPAFGVIRWFDASGLADRLVTRPMRLALYGVACQAVHKWARLGAAVANLKPDWRLL